MMVGCLPHSHDRTREAWVTKQRGRRNTARSQNLVLASVRTPSRATRVASIPRRGPVGRCSYGASRSSTGGTVLRSLPDAEQQALSCLALHHAHGEDVGARASPQPVLLEEVAGALRVDQPLVGIEDRFGLLVAAPIAHLAAQPNTPPLLGARPRSIAEVL